MVLATSGVFGQANGVLYNATNNILEKPQYNNQEQTEHFTLPFHLIDGFILIEATVNDVKGKLMFDTGTPFSFFLNNNQLNLDKSKQLGKGKAGSGQKIVLFKSESPVSVDFDPHLKNIIEKNTIHTDFKFVEEGITSDFLGFIGYGFFKDYEFMIDYDNQIIEFFLLKEKTKSVFKNKFPKEKAVEIINFENTEAVNVPKFELKIASYIFPAYLDTGNQGKLVLTPETKKQLLQNSILETNRYSFWYGKFREEKYTANLRTARIQATPIKKIKNLDIEEGKNKIHLGYQFLKMYKSLWNFQNNTITLFER